MAVKNVYILLELELRASHLLGRRSTTWAMFPAPDIFLILTGSGYFLDIAI
jgi:hypothetical protein